MATSSGFGRLLVAYLVLSTICAFTVTPRQHCRLGMIHNPLYPVQTLSPMDRRMALNNVEDGGILGDQSKSRLATFRGRIRNFLRFTTRNKRKKLLALVFAVSIWLRGIQFQEIPAACAADVVEEVEINLHIEGGSSDAEEVSEEVDDSVLMDDSVVVATAERKGMSRKLALAGGVILIPSAGLLVTRGQNKADLEKLKDEISAEPEASSKKLETEVPSTHEESPSEEEKRNLVQSVLARARKARQEVDAENYSKSLAKEDEFEVTKSVTSARRGTVESVAPALDEMATNSDLPLMTPQFVLARQQPKDPIEEQLLRQKYQAITDLSERAFAILLDLGMIETDDTSVVVGLPVSGNKKTFQ